MKKIIFIIAGSVVLVAVFFALRFVLAVSNEIKLPDGQRDFRIEAGQSVKQITNDLMAKGVINNDFWFRIYVWLRRKEGDFIAAKFDLPEKINMIHLVSLLTSQNRQGVLAVKILEGWGIRDIAIYFENLGMFQQEEITESVGLPTVDYGQQSILRYIDFSTQFPILNVKPAQYGLEGFLFPDTYEIFADSTVVEVIEKMLSNFESKMSPDLLAEINRQGKNLYDVLIMASIVEAEVPQGQDRPIVAGVFWSRLGKGVPLQSDATLNYAIGGDNPRLTAEQLRKDSPYNSYLYPGLPPTPIGNPGLDAIRAAIYPQESDYFYFLSTPQGETIFSKTLEEHNKNKAKYY